MMEMLEYHVKHAFKCKDMDNYTLKTTFTGLTDLLSSEEQFNKTVIN